MANGASERALRVLAVANWDPARAEAPWAGQRVAALRAAGVEVDLLAEECVLDRGGFVRLWRRLDERLESGRYDVVAPLYGSLLGLLCASQRRVPCVLSLAGSDLHGAPSPRGGAALSSLPSRLASQLGAVLAGAVSVRSARMRSALWWPPARRRCEVIGSGVDVARFCPLPRDEARRRRHLPLDGHRVAFVALRAAARPVKRIALARAAMERLPGVALDVVDGLPLDEMPWAYAACDALLVTSHAEGSPNCVKEALACARPVVSVDVGDVREVLAGIDNCAVAEATPAALATALERVLTDGRGCPDGPRRMAERCSLEAMAARFVGLYQRASGIGPWAPARATAPMEEGHGAVGG